MTSKSVQTSVIIVNFNGGSMLMDAVDSVFEQKEVNLSIIIVDNSSTDGSAREVKQKYPAITLIENDQNYFFCKGANLGIKYALDSNSDYIFLLNNDATMFPDSMRALVSFMEDNSEVGACQPLLVFAHDQKIIQSAGCRISLSGLSWDHLCNASLEAGGTTPYKIPGATGGAMMLRPSALKQVGLFPEFFEMYFEDVDLSLRLRQAGWEIFCLPKVLVSHIRSATTDKTGVARRVFYCERNSYAIVMRHFPFYAIIAIMPFKLILASIMAAVQLAKGNMTTAKAIIKGMYWGLRSVFKPNRFSSVKTNSLNHVDSRIFPPNCQ